jgi:hypothetical protein
MDTNGVTSRTQPSASLDVESGVQNSAVSQRGCLGSVGKTLAAALVLGAGGVGCIVGAFFQSNPKGHETVPSVLLSIAGGLLIAATAVTLCTLVPTSPDVNNNRSAPSRSGGDTLTGFAPTGGGCGGGGGGCGGGGF